MNNKSRTPELREVAREVHRKLLEWEQEIECSKKPDLRQYRKTIGYRGEAAILQYNASVKIALLGAELLERSIENRKESLLLGLTKRPMFESYTRGIWFEYVAKEERAKRFLSRRKEDKNRKWTTLGSEQETPPLGGMWDAVDNVLQEENEESQKWDPEERRIIREAIKWMKKGKDWWNDSTHVTARSAWMGWSNEYGEMIQNDEQMRSDLVTLVEIGARCAGRIHALSELNNTRDRRILQEKQRLRDILEFLHLG